MSNNSEMLDAILSVIVSKISERVSTDFDLRLRAIEERLNILDVKSDTAASEIERVESGLESSIASAVEDALEGANVERMIERALEECDFIDEHTIDRKISEAIDEHNSDFDHDDFVERDKLEEEVKQFLGDLTFKLVTAE